MIITLLDASKTVTLFGQRLSIDNRSIEISKTALLNEGRTDGRDKSSDLVDLEILFQKGLIQVIDDGVIIPTFAYLMQVINNGYVGTPGGTDATSIRTVPVDPALPTTPNEVLLFDGTKYIPTLLTQDMILPAFAISSFGVTPSLAEVGQSVATPPFTASYTLPPDVAANSVVLTDDAGSAPKDVTATPNAFTSNGTFMRNAYGLSYTFTVTAKKGASIKVALAPITWTQRVYWGVAAVPGAYDAAFIHSLASNALATSRARSFTVTAGVGQKIYYAYRAGYGDASFTVNGFSGGFFKAAAAVSVTNAFGFVENYMVWESDNPNLGLTTVGVS